MKWALLAVLLLPGAGAWDTFQGDARNTGAGPDAHRWDVSSWWSADAGAFVAAAPLAVDGQVIVADLAGTVTALDGTTGETRWQQALGDAVRGTPVAASGRLFVADAKGTLYALDLGRGDILADTKVGPTHGALSYSQGKVFLGTEAGEVKALSSELDLLWTFDTGTVGTSTVWNNSTKLFDCVGLLPGKPVRGAPAVADGVVIVGSMSHHVFALDEHGEPDGTTTLLWSAATDDLVLAAPVLAEDQVFIASYDEHVRALPLGNVGSACTGAIVAPSWSHDDGARLHATPAWNGGLLVVAGQDGMVRALRGPTTVWSHDAGAPITASPVIANGTALVATDAGELLWLSMHNGSLLNRFDAGGPVKQAPALWQDATFVVTEDGHVQRLAPGILRLPDWRIGNVAFTTGVLNVTVHNDGAGDAPGTLVRVLENGTELAFAIVPALPPGGEYEASMPLDLGPGGHDLVIDVDGSNEVQEEQEANQRAFQVDAAGPISAAGLLGLPLWVWIVAGVASLGGGGGGGFWFWWRRRE